MNEAFDNLRQAVDNSWSVIVQEWHDHKWRFIAVYVIVVIIAFFVDWLRW